MVDQPPRQTFSVGPPGENPDYRFQPGGDFAVELGSEIGAKWRSGWGPQAWQRLAAGNHEADPNYDPWGDLKGYEEFSSDLVEARSKAEMDALKLNIDRNKLDRATAARGQFGLMGDLIAGAFDPVNVLPIPAVKGIGLVRGALVLGGVFGATTAGTEAIRQYADPLSSDPWESVSTIALGTLLGAAIGGPVGAFGAREARFRRALDAYETGLTDLDSPNFSLRPRGTDEGMVFKYSERPLRDRDGSIPRFSVSTDQVGYAMRVDNGVNYVFEDGKGWFRASERGMEVPTRLPDDVVDRLGLPEPVFQKTMRVDEAVLKHEFETTTTWRDELQGHIEGEAQVQRVVRDGNDYVNFRTIEKLWQDRWPIREGESMADWHARVGKKAMREFRASKVSGEYSGPTGLAWALERMNYSPVAKLIRTFVGDNVMADLALRLAGDYGWAIKANEFGWSTPPSVLLKAVRHTARFAKFKSEFDAEWLKFVTGNQQAEGKIVQGLNMSAMKYAVARGARRAAGANVFTYADFEEMATLSLFNRGDFEVNGHPVNDNARSAGKAFTRLMEEYDDLHRETGNFRDQKNIARDIKRWERDRDRLQTRVMQWLFGQTGAPRSHLAAIRVTTAGAGRVVPGQLLEEFAPRERIFKGATHEDAIRAMIDELGAEGIRLSEQLTPENYGWYPRAADEFVSNMIERGGPPLPPEGQVIDLAARRRRAEMIRRIEDDPRTMEEQLESAAGDELDLLVELLSKKNPNVNYRLLAQMTPGERAMALGVIDRPRIADIPNLPGELRSTYDDWRRETFGEDAERMEAPENAAETRTRFLNEQLDEGFLTQAEFERIMNGEPDWAEIQETPAYLRRPTAEELAASDARMREELGLSEEEWNQLEREQLDREMEDFQRDAEKRGETTFEAEARMAEEETRGTVRDPIWSGPAGEKRRAMANVSIDRAEQNYVEMFQRLHDEAVANINAEQLKFRSSLPKELQEPFWDFVTGKSAAAFIKAAEDWADVHGAFPPEIGKIVADVQTLALTTPKQSAARWTIQFALDYENALIDLSKLSKHDLEVLLGDKQMDAPYRRAVMDTLHLRRMLDQANDMAELVKTRDFPHDPAFVSFKTAGEALDYIRRTSKDPDHLRLVEAIYKEVKDIPFKVIDRDGVNLGDDFEAGLLGAIGRFSGVRNRMIVRGEWPSRMHGTNPEVVLHEAVHGAGQKRIAKGMQDIVDGIDSPHARMVRQLDAFHRNLLLAPERKAFEATLTEAERQEFDGAMQAISRKLGISAKGRRIVEMNDLHELLTYGLTQPEFRAFLKAMPARHPRGGIRSAWHEFLKLLSDLLGVRLTRKQFNQFDRLMNMQERVNALEQPTGVRGWDAIHEMVARDDPAGFVTQADMMAQREAMLSPRQREIYRDRKSALDMADARIVELNGDLATVTEQPHRFVNANGEAEPYFHRSWDVAKASDIVDNGREKLTRAITGWYERDNPDGARSRAEATLDNILSEETYFPGSGTMSAMKQRTLNIPNSWSIEDPQFGTIRISDFIDKRMTSIAEHYVKRSAPRIEAARMFGDAELRAEKVRMREHLLEQHYERQTTDAGRAEVMRRIELAENHLETMRKQVMGVVRTSDPWRLDNRIARDARILTQMAVMGKSALTSLPEIIRPGMTQGMGTYFRVIFQKYLDDLESMRGNIEFGGLSGELTDLTMNQNNVRQAMMEDGEPIMGGTSWERWINQHAGDIYKISGLTSLTTWQKTMTLLAAQHTVMDEARKIGFALEAGLPVDQRALFRLAAIGIKERDALLLSRMPVEFYQGGKLIMPGVDAWKALGPDGRRARDLLLNAIHAESRRAIVTPSIGDRSTVFNGVWTRDGKIVGESDLMTIPTQFLSYGMGAHNKLLTSMIQGRDRTVVMGLVYMYMLAMMANWLKTDAEAWRRKTYDQILYEAYDNAGIGGFWFGGLNTQLERASNNRYGLRPALGIKQPGPPLTDLQAAIGGLGTAPGHFSDLARAFYDTSISGTTRAGLIRRAIPYNNVLYWDGLFRELARVTGEAFEGTRQ